MSVAVPPKTVDVVLESALLAMLHGVQPGPLNITSALVGSKADPVMVNVNDCPAIGGLGAVVIVVSWGVPALEPVTVNRRLFDVTPLDTF